MPSINFVGNTGTVISPSPTGVLTPTTSSDFAVIVANNTSPSIPTGWSQSWNNTGFPIYSKQLSSSSPVHISDLGIFDVGLGSWANVLASFPVTGTVSSLQGQSFGGGGVGTGPHTTAFSVDVTAGSTILVFISQDGPNQSVDQLPITIVDNQNNQYLVASAHVQVPYGAYGYTVGAWLWMAYNVSAGPLSITWTMPPQWGSNIAGGAFELTSIAPPLPPAPTVSGCSPASGVTGGGTPCTITGTGFSGSTVTFDGIPATSVTVVNSTTITCHTPAHSIGAVNIVVTNADTQTGTLVNGFTYVESVPLSIAGQPLVMTFVTPQDNPLANGYVTFRLSTDAKYSGGQISAGVTTKVLLDSSGSMSDSTVIPNNIMTPSDTVYFVKAYAFDGQLVWENELYVT